MKSPALILAAGLVIFLPSVLARSLHKRAAFYIANETACIVDSIVYYNGDPIPTDDPCEACKCRPPGFACVLRECEAKPGCRAVRKAGHCCPDYECGCEHNGRMYRDGDEIRDSQNPCYTCHCQGSAIACAFVDCFFRVDCAPNYTTGECCPRYDHCSPLASSANESSPKEFYGDNQPHIPTEFESFRTTIKAEVFTEEPVVRPAEAPKVPTEEEDLPFNPDYVDAHHPEIPQDQSPEPKTTEPSSTPSPAIVKDIHLLQPGQLGPDAPAFYIPNEEAIPASEEKAIPVNEEEIPVNEEKAVEELAKEATDSPNPGEETRDLTKADEVTTTISESSKPIFYGNEETKSTEESSTLPKEENNESKLDKIILSEIHDVEDYGHDSLYPKKETEPENVVSTKSASSPTTTAFSESSVEYLSTIGPIPLFLNVVVPKESDKENINNENTTVILDTSKNLAELSNDKSPTIEDNSHATSDITTNTPKATTDDILHDTQPSALSEETLASENKRVGKQTGDKEEKSDDAQTVTESQTVTIAESTKSEILTTRKSETEELLADEKAATESPSPSESLKSDTTATTRKEKSAANIKAETAPPTLESIATGITSPEKDTPDTSKSTEVFKTQDSETSSTTVLTSEASASNLSTQTDRITTKEKSITGN